MVLVKKWQLDTVKYHRKHAARFGLSDSEPFSYRSFLLDLRLWLVLLSPSIGWIGNFVGRLSHPPSKKVEKLLATAHVKGERE